MLLQHRARARNRQTGTQITVISTKQAQRVSETGIFSERFLRGYRTHAAILRAIHTLLPGAHARRGPAGGQPWCCPSPAGAPAPPGFSPAGVYAGDVPAPGAAGLYCVDGIAGVYWYDADGACPAEPLGGAPAGEYAA